MKWLVLIVLLVGCGHSGPTRLYALGTRAGATRPSSAVIAVQRPTVPGYLDRHDLVLGVSDAQLQVLGGASWAEPLPTMLARVLALNLEQRLPGARVLGESSTQTQSADVQIGLELRRFESREAGEVTLDAMLSLRRRDPGQPVVLQAVRLTRPLADDDADALVEALDGLIAALADRTVELLEALPQPDAES